MPFKLEKASVLRCCENVERLLVISGKYLMLPETGLGRGEHYGCWTLPHCAVRGGCFIQPYCLMICEDLCFHSNMFTLYSDISSRYVTCGPQMLVYYFTCIYIDCFQGIQKFCYLCSSDCAFLIFLFSLFLNPPFLNLHLSSFILGKCKTWLLEKDVERTWNLIGYNLANVSLKRPKC